MPEWNDDVKQFMTYWFDGFAEGLAGIDEPARKTILSACGKACARSYTACQFQDAWKESANLESFLAALSVRFPEAAYTLTGPREIRVRLARCACDLVRLGLVTSPLLCDCSAQNLETNFASAIGAPVTVTLETTLLRGGDYCGFSVQWGDASWRRA